MVAYQGSGDRGESLPMPPHEGYQRKGPTEDALQTHRLYQEDS